MTIVKITYRKQSFVKCYGVHVNNDQAKFA